MRALQWLIILVLIFSTASCSRQLGYRFADTLVSWQLARYMDLDREQRRAVRGEVDKLIQWHAESELPKYHQLLSDVRFAIERDTIDANFLENLAEKLPSYWFDLRDAVLEPVLRLTPMLNDEQMAQLLENLMESLDEQREEYRNRDAEERIERRLTPFERQFRNIAGRPTNEQSEIMLKLATETPDVNELWFDYRERWLVVLRETLVERDNPEVLRAGMTLLISNPESLRPDALQQHMDANQQGTIDALVFLYASLTDRQRRSVLRNIEGYQRDIRSMMRQRNVN
ncbi:MAG: hypothetical protein JJU10_05330 [Idiomarina sp.]|nr:hypothetical protein [Idiomarina sp.]